MSDEKEKIRLTVLARKSDIHWQNLLDDSFRFQKAVFVRLKGQGTLTVFDKIDNETKEATFQKVDLKIQLWKLPDRELEQMILDLPPWKISSVLPPAPVQAEPQTFQFEIVPETVDENDLFLFRVIDETENHSTDDSKTKHVATDKDEAKRFVFWNWEIRHKPSFDRLSTKKEKLENIYSCMDWVDEQKLLLESNEDLIIDDNEPFPTVNRLRSYQRLLAFLKEFDEQIAFEKWDAVEIKLEDPLEKSPEKKQGNKPSSLKVSDAIDFSGKRKIHTRFIVVAKSKNLDRAAAWKWLIDLAQESRGHTEVKIPGWGNTYLRRVRLNPEKEILYFHEPINLDKDEKPQDGVKMFNFNSFTKAWTKIK